MFSFNNPYGACPKCTGLGTQLLVDPELIIPDGNLSILDGAITASGWQNVRGDSISKMYFDALAKKYHFKLTTPVKELTSEIQNVIMYGTGGEPLELRFDGKRGTGVLHQPFEGVANNLARRYRESQSPAVREDIEECMRQAGKSTMGSAIP